MWGSDPVHQELRTCPKVRPPNCEKNIPFNRVGKRGHDPGRGARRFNLIGIRSKYSELGVGLCVADPHRDLKVAGVTIALDQMRAYSVRLQLHTRLLTTGRLSATLLATWLLVLELLAYLCIP